MTQAIDNAKNKLKVWKILSELVSHYRVKRSASCRKVKIALPSIYKYIHGLSYPYRLIKGFWSPQLSMRRWGIDFLYFLSPFSSSCFVMDPFFLESSALQARSASVTSPENSSKEIELSWSLSLSSSNVFASSWLRFMPRP